jgi:hypothetical protein
MNPRIHVLTAAVIGALGFAPLALSQTSTDTTSGTTSASAGQSSGSGITWPHQRGFWGHVGASIGGAQLDATCPPGSGCDDSENAFRVFGGGRFNNTFGAEVGYIKFGDFARGGGETDARAWDFALIAGIPFANNWSVFGKLGAVYSDVDVTGTGLRTGSDNGWGPRAGIGLQMGLTQNWALRLDLDRYRIKTPGERMNVDTILLGAQYTFR